MKRLLLTNLGVIVALLISSISFADPTHMGVEPQELVSLILVCEVPEGEEVEVCSFKRSPMLGKMEQDFFEIPEGKVLIVTEFDWKYTTGFGSELEDQLIEVNLNRALLCLDNCPKPAVKSFAIAHPFGAFIGGAIFASNNVQMTTGFAIAAPEGLFVTVLDIAGKSLPKHDDFSQLEATVRGYLVTATCGIPGTPPCR